MDLIDEILSDWAMQRPDINVSGKAVVCRILQVYSYMIAELERSLKLLKITPNIFSVLVTIRRKGPDAELPVKNIMHEVLVTSGGMSNLLNRLIHEDLVIKRKGAEMEDSRSAFIKLTPNGLSVIDKAMEIQAACECKLTQALTSAEKQQLSALLYKIKPEEDYYVERK